MRFAANKLSAVTRTMSSVCCSDVLLTSLSTSRTNAAAIVGTHLGAAAAAADATARLSAAAVVQSLSCCSQLTAGHSASCCPLSVSTSPTYASILPLANATAVLV